MGQDGIPLSIAIFLSIVILGATFLIGSVVAAMLFGISMP
jgi:hypothetical protein